MRSKIDYGIDLGTTNSAIARMEKGVPVIMKSDTLKNTMPSCVHFTQNQGVLVGDPAFNVLKNDHIRALKGLGKDSSNSFIEFKRTMGTTHTYKCPNMGRNFTSEELSAEVLKKLQSFISDEDISSVVITVPAKFHYSQVEATMQAAELAGFNHVELLQKPIAVAFAYGLGSKNKDGFWLVFDFGGGTFDAALVKSEEGVLSVKDTDGNNWLGGKNLDEAIVDRIIIPYLQENFAIDNILHDPDQRAILRNAVNNLAEEAKIQLSSKETHMIFSQPGDLPFEDENGAELEIEIFMTQKDMESTLSPIFQKTIDIVNGLLARNNLKGSDLGSVILAGGSTCSSILHRMLCEQVSEKIDTSLDPMIVAAKGAALFASTLPLSEELIEMARDKTKLQLDVKYEASTVETEELIIVKLLKDKSTGRIHDKIYVEIVRCDGMWSSGKRPIGEKGILMEILLTKDCANSFNIFVYDEEENQLECQPNQFCILQGIFEPFPTLPYHIGVGKHFSEYSRELFIPVKGLEKNRILPATGVINGLKTRSEIRPGNVNDMIRIPIYQGDHDAEGTNPVLVTELVITGEKMPDLLPAGSEVDITIKVDKSQLMKFIAYFPLLNYTEELKIEIKQIEPPVEEDLKNEINYAKEIAQQISDNESLRKLEGLIEQLKYEKGSVAGKMEILNNLRKELLYLERCQKVAKWKYKVDQLQGTFDELEDMIKTAETTDIDVNKFKNDLEKYRLQKNILISEPTDDKSTEWYKLENEMGGTRFMLMIQVEPKMFIQYFAVEFDNIHWKDPIAVKQLILSANNIKDREDLSAIVIQLYQLMEAPYVIERALLRGALG